MIRRSCTASSQTLLFGSSSNGSSRARRYETQRHRDWGALGWFAITLTLLVWQPGCKHTVPAEFTTSTKLPDADRRPDGIAIDLSSEPPEARDQATSVEEIVTLRTPLPVGAAHRAVRQLFEAVIREDVGAMSQVMSSATMVQDIRTGKKNLRAHSATSHWRQRFRKREYQKLSTKLVYRQADVETYRSDHTASLPVNVRHLSRNNAIGETDLVLRVPIVTHSIRNERLLGDEIFLWLRREGTRYIVYHIAEPLPF